MANTKALRYTTQITPMVEPEIAGELAAWASLTGETAATMAREALYEGLARKREEWAAEHGPMPKGRLQSHIAQAVARGERRTAAKRRAAGEARKATE